MSVDFVGVAKRVGCFSFDVEHNPALEFSQPDFRLVGCGFATEGTSLFVRDLVEVGRICRALFPLADVEAVAFKGNYDLKCLVAVGVIDAYDYPKRLCDPMIAMNLLDDNRRPNQLGLKKIIFDLFGRRMMTFDEAWACGGDSDAFSKYGADDAKEEYLLWKYQKPQLERQGLLKLFERILMPACKVFADIETVGIGWDAERASQLRQGFAESRERLEGEIKSEIGDLNLNSGDQLAKRLFGQLGYSTDNVNLTTSKKRYSVGADAMDVLAVRYPVCAKIRAHRTAAKMVNTYLDPLSERASRDPEGRIHANYWLVSATGRTRADDPNLQNVPAHLDSKHFDGLKIRECVVPAPGRKLVVADYSQMQLRLCAHVSQDESFLRAYQQWRCATCGNRGDAGVILHACPECGANENEAILSDKDAAGFWHGSDLHRETADTVTALQGSREEGKRTNFSVIFGVSARTLHQRYPSLSQQRWQDVIDEFFALHDGIRDWHARTNRQLWDEGVIRDVFGRKRRFRESDINRSPRHAFNQAANFPIQSSECELFELALSKMRERWVAAGTWLREIWPTNMVHDEVVFEILEESVDEYVPQIRDVMEHATVFRVPIRVDITICDNWGQAK